MTIIYQYKYDREMQFFVAQAEFLKKGTFGAQYEQMHHDLNYRDKYQKNTRKNFCHLVLEKISYGVVFIRNEKIINVIVFALKNFFETGLWKPLTCIIGFRSLR